VVLVLEVAMMIYYWYWNHALRSPIFVFLNIPSRGTWRPTDYRLAAVVQLCLTVV